MIIINRHQWNIFKGCDLLMSYHLSCILQGFHRAFLPLVHGLTLSLSDLPPEGSSGGRHPADSTGQEPGPEGGSSEGLYWRCAVYSPAWALHRLCGVSIPTYGFNNDSQMCMFRLMSTEVFAEAVCRHFSPLCLFNYVSHYLHCQYDKMEETTDCPIHYSNLYLYI